ncbi:hypothetical protein L1987_16332 [Smallanthus sonchifolius]|uniref:Uncharacterized protein n=1 Tax=Smallanthus sonchifolius TaxID=185202 RepID=A0ACB9J8J5_9ASTR|nr:hypothetical protein L1987_16332 [Smallanthus sonchifolius]
MSGEGSSSRSGRKRRGPTPHPRGDAAEQDYNPNLGQRRIKYHTRERIPNCRVTRLREHPLLQFELGTQESRKLDTLIDTNLLQFRTIDWTLLDHIGQRDRIEALLGDKFRAALCCMASQYEELTIEFHATFRYKQGNCEQHDAVSFSLGRQVYEMTMPQFAVATQLYTQAEVQTPEFITSVRGVFTRQHDYSLVRNDLVKFWGTISNAPFSGSSGENKIKQVDLFCLLCMVEQRPANVASIIAWSMKRTWRGGPDAGIYMGPYVTRIAESLGVFDKYEARYLKDGPFTVMMGVRELQFAGILSMHEPPSWEPIRAGPQGQPPAGSEAAAAMQSGIPARYQRPLHRSERPAPQYPLQQPRPDPLTLDSMYDRMEHGFRELHGLVTTAIMRSGPAFYWAATSGGGIEGSSGQQYSGYGQYGSYGQPGSSGQYGADRSPPEFPIFEAESEEDEE